MVALVTCVVDSGCAIGLSGDLLLLSKSLISRISSHATLLRRHRADGRKIQRRKKVPLHSAKSASVFSLSGAFVHRYFGLRRGQSFLFRRRLWHRRWILGHDGECGSVVVLHIFLPFIAAFGWRQAGLLFVRCGWRSALQGLARS